MCPKRGRLGAAERNVPRAISRWGFVGPWGEASCTRQEVDSLRNMLGSVRWA